MDAEHKIRALCTIAALTALCTAVSGQVYKKPLDEKPPVLRAVSVYEWTGPMEKPTASRMVPVCVYDGDALQDGTVYLSRPEPLAVAPQVEYEIEASGHPVGLFAVQNAARIEGNWVGLGAPLPLPKPTHKRQQFQKIDDFGESDRPVLYRKHSQANTNGQSASGASQPAPADDADRPHLNRKSDAPATASGTQNAPADNDRPVLHKPKPAVQTSAANAGQIDPNRPRLLRGHMGELNLDLTPQLKGLPADMNQAVAVSDATTRPEHLWKYRWADSSDEKKMKAALEQIALDAMGMKPLGVPLPAGKHSKKTAPAAIETPAAPQVLGDEIFKSFELAYNSNATLVLTATNNLAGKEAKYITLIAQPDLYGNPLIVFKQVTDLFHLDERPRMRLIDAVDAMADRRAELLFELRTTDDRQFALYRVYRGTAELIFTTGVPQN